VNRATVSTGRRRERQTVDVPSSQDQSTRDRLIVAARDSFLEQGYQTTSVAAIARRAGLTTGAIYSNFPNKAALLAEAIALEGLALWGVGLARAAELDDPLDRAVEINTNAIAGAGRSVDRLILDGWVASLHDAETGEQVRRNLDSIAAAVRSQVAAGLERGEIAEDTDVEALVAFLEVLVMGGLVRRSLGRPQPDRSAVEHLLRRLFSSLGSD